MANYVLKFYNLITWRDNYDIYDLIINGTANVKMIDYEFAPYVNKAIWNNEGDYISKKEKMRQNVGNKQYFTLRLDIKNMSKIKRLVFEEKWSNDFANIMKKIALKLAIDLNAKYAYTQSDEISLVFFPGENENFEYMFGGRHDKLVSLSAAQASSIFNLDVRSMLETKKLTIDLKEVPLVLFDCRMGVFDTLKDAFRLILWRAYDCGVNGISDAVFNMEEQEGLPGKKKRTGLGTMDKLDILAEYQILPLENHQAYGSLFVRRKIIKTGWNPKLQQTVESLRSVVEFQNHCWMNVLNMVKYEEIIL